MKSTDPVLEFDNVGFAYPDGPVSLREVSFSIPSGSKVALVGPNGAGKTTLLLMCNGILRPGSGEIRVHGKPLSYDRAALREVRKKVGFVFQNSENQLFAPTVFQDVAFGPVNLDLTPGDVREAVRQALFSVGLSGFEKRPPHRLSGGEKKRVAIAGVLAMNPDILVFDEPTSSLDPATAAEIMDLLDELNSQGRTVLVSTHDVQMAYSWADQVILISNGTILHQGVPASIFTSPDLMRRARLTIPPVLELFMTLQERNLSLGTTPPAGIPEMAHLLEQAAGCPNSRSPGHIYIADAGKMTGAAIRSGIEDRSVHHVGAMGTQAKIAAAGEGIPLTFTYGVIDKCLLKAVMGEDCLIITSGGMVEHIYRRIGSFCQEHRVTIPVSAIG